MEKSKRAPAAKAARRKSIRPGRALKYRYLALIYTLKCNISCGHCINNSGPGRHEKIRLDDALRYFREGKKAGIDQVFITGGEAILYLDEVCRLAEAARKMRLKFTVVTNCFWAETPESADRTLKRLRDAGVARLNASTDRFHLAHIPLRNILNIKEPADRYGISTSVNVCFHGSDDAVGEGLVKELIDFGFRVSKSMVTKAGRGSKLTGKRIGRDYLKRPCLAAKLLTLTPDSAYACCCGSDIMGATNPLLLPDPRKTALTKIKATAESIPFLDILRAFGPNELMTMAGLEPWRGLESVHSCELCARMLNDPGIVRKLTELTDKPSAEMADTIECARLYDKYLEDKAWK